MFGGIALLCCMTNLGNSVIGSKSNSRQTRRTNPPSPLPPPITITLFIKLRRNCRIQIIMPSQDPGRRRPIPTRVKIIMTCIMLALSAGMVRFAVFVGKKEGFEPEKWPKPFPIRLTLNQKLLIRSRFQEVALSGRYFWKAYLQDSGRG